MSGQNKRPLTSLQGGKWTWQDAKKELVFESADARASRRRQNRPWVPVAPPTSPLKPSVVSGSAGPVSENRKVGLEDVKVVAVSLISTSLLQKMKKSTTVLFDECYRTEQMNILLWTTLLYFDAFLEHDRAKRDENLHIPGELGRGARETLESSHKRLEQADADVGAAYAHFILGLGHMSSHHSLQGRMHVSRTHTDRDFYEVVYEFAMYVTWVTFSYEHWILIHKELGRLFRTAPFNKTLLPPGEGHSADLEGLGSVNVDSDQYFSYKVYYDRPPVGSLDRLCSPALRNYMPSSKDKPIKTSRHPEDVRPLPQSEISCPERLGIIGEEMSKLDPHTLKYKEAVTSDSDSEESEDGSDISGIIEDDGNDDIFS